MQWGDERVYQTGKMQPLPINTHLHLKYSHPLLWIDLGGRGGGWNHRLDPDNAEKKRSSRHTPWEMKQLGKNMMWVTNTLKHTHTRTNSGTQARSHGQPIKCNTPLENRRAEWIAAMLLVLPLSFLPKWSLRFHSDSQKLQLFKFLLHNDLPSPCKAACLVALYLYLEIILSSWILQAVGDIFVSWRRPRISSPVFLYPDRMN